MGVEDDVDDIPSESTAPGCVANILPGVFNVPRRGILCMLVITDEHCSG